MTIASKTHHTGDVSRGILSLEGMFQVLEKVGVLVMSSIMNAIDLVFAEEGKLGR